MSASSEQPAGQAYFVGSSKPSESSGHEAPSAGVSRPPMVRLPVSTPLSQRPRRSLSGVKIFLMIMTIAAPIAFIFFTDESLSPKVDIVPAWITSLIDRYAVAVSARAKEVQALWLQAARRPESRSDDVATAQSIPDLKSRTTENGTVEDKNASPMPLLLAPPPPTEAQGIAAGEVSEPQIRTPARLTTTPSDGMSTTITAKMAASSASVEGMTTESSTVDRKIAAAPNLGLGSEVPPLREAQAGVRTYCTVDLIPGGQIAVQKATTYRTCISAGKKCAGNRRYADIQFFGRPTLTSKVPLELCDTEF